MESLKQWMDLKTGLFTLLLALTTVGQQLGWVQPARQEAGTVIEIAAEAQGVASDALARVNELQKQLAECLKRCGGGSP